MSIGLDPVVVAIGPLPVGWVTLFILAGLAVGGWLALRWAAQLGIGAGAAYGVVLQAVVWGLVGARLLHVLDYWSFYSEVPFQAVYVWTGGLSLWGGILGGALSAGLYARRAGMPVWRLGDVAALAALAGQAVARVGDVLTGERLAKATSLPWGITYTHPDSVSYTGELMRLHPVGLYELLWDAALLVVLWRFRTRIRPDGALFVAYLAGYAAGRTIISFARLDPVLVLGLQQAQVVGIAVLVACGVLLWRWRAVRKQPS